MKKILRCLKLTTLMLVGAALMAVSMILFAQSSENYVLRTSVLDESGGSLSSNLNKSEILSIGQPSPIGISHSNSYVIHSGYIYTTEIPCLIPPEIVGEELPNAMKELLYSSFISVRAGTGTRPLYWALIDGVLPASLELNRDSGEIFGVPGDTGIFNFSIQVQDWCESLDSRQFSLRVIPFKEIIGDVTGDTIINVLDVIAVINQILGTISLGGNAFHRADCTGNGVVNVLDALSIVNVILGIIPECPGDGYKPEVNSEVLEFLHSLKPYLSEEDYSTFMVLVRKSQLPTEYRLSQNYPNPFNPVTEIRYHIPEIGSWDLTVLKIYNILGQEVRTLVDERQEAGQYAITWEGKNNVGEEVASGLYICQMKSGSFLDSRKMMLVR